MGLHCHSTDQVLGGSDKVWHAFHGRLKWLDCSCTIQFMFSKFYLYRAVCDGLAEEDRVTEAIEYFQNMKIDLIEETQSLDNWPQWELGE
jgi:hypothetical protein